MAKWLMRSLHQGPYLALARSKKEFVKAIRQLKVPQHTAGKWIANSHADATTHSFTNQDGNQCCVVCIRAEAERSPLEICGLLVHEAVHVFQQHCDWIGERQPSVEFEAYAIQCIAQRLIEAYSEK